MVRRDGAPSAIRNIGIKDGHVAAVSADDLDETHCPNIIDASGKWVLPGLVDIHTHYDIEVLAAPALSESVRHGVTTVLLGSCSCRSYTSTASMPGTSSAGWRRYRVTT